MPVCAGLLLVDHITKQKTSHVPRGRVGALAGRSCPPLLRKACSMAELCVLASLVAPVVANCWWPDSALARKRFPEDFFWCLPLFLSSCTLVSLTSAAVEGPAVPRCPQGHPVFDCFCTECGQRTSLPQPPASSQGLTTFFGIFHPQDARVFFSVAALLGLTACVACALFFVGSSVTAEATTEVGWLLRLLLPLYIALVLLQGGQKADAERGHVSPDTTRSTPRFVGFYVAACWVIALPAIAWPAPQGSHWFFLVLMGAYTLAFGALNSSVPRGPCCPQGHPVHAAYCSVCGLPRAVPEIEEAWPIPQRL